jgi:signal transduction histidine kinase
LLSNAVKFTPEGGSVTLSCERSRDEVRIRVRDTGIGIAPENRALIFERFRQVDGSLTRRYSGLGVGLALADEAGRIQVANPTMRELWPQDSIPDPLPPPGPQGQWLMSPIEGGQLVTLIPADPERRRQMLRLQELEDRHRRAVLEELRTPVEGLVKELEQLPGLELEVASLREELGRIATGLVHLSEGEPLLESLASFVARFPELRVTLRLPQQEPALPAMSAFAARRIVEEALNNVCRHARASRVEVGLALEASFLRGWIQDDGQGFEQASSGRLGLHGMRFRAELAGGGCQVNSGPGGTRVEFRVPRSGDC